MFVHTDTRNLANCQKGNLHVYLSYLHNKKGDMDAMIMVLSCDVSAILSAVPSTISKKFTEVTIAKYTARKATCVVSLKFVQMITQSSD